MDASSRDNRTTAIHEGVRRKSKNLLFADRKEQDLTSVDLGWEKLSDSPSFLPFMSCAPIDKSCDLFITPLFVIPGLTRNLGDT